MRHPRTSKPLVTSNARPTAAAKPDVSTQPGGPASVPQRKPSPTRPNGPLAGLTDEQWEEFFAWAFKDYFAHERD
jgi:hypothetical protein